MRMAKGQQQSRHDSEVLAKVSATLVGAQNVLSELQWRQMLKSVSCMCYL